MTDTEPGWFEWLDEVKMVARAAEREECAKISDDNAGSSCSWTCDCGHRHCEDIAAKIRGRK